MRKGKRVVSGGLPESFLISLVISALVIILLSLASALIANLLDDPTRHLGLFALGTMLISAAVSGICCARIKGDGSVGFAALVALAIVLVMLLINVILSAGKVTAAAFMNYGCYIGVYTLSAFLGKKKDKHRRHGR